MHRKSRIHRIDHPSRTKRILHWRVSNRLSFIFVFGLFSFRGSFLLRWTQCFRIILIVLSERPTRTRKFVGFVHRIAHFAADIHTFLFHNTRSTRKSSIFRGSGLFQSCFFRFGQSLSGTDQALLFAFFVSLGLEPSAYSFQGLAGFGWSGFEFRKWRVLVFLEKVY